jgi:dienelactone hydrolase
MRGELVSVTTEDRVRLHGFLRAAEHVSGTHEVDRPVKLPADAAIVVHGLAGNFYNSKLLNYFSDRLATMGIDNVLVNTRGHDYLNATVQSGKTETHGAAVETIDDAKFDLFAWAEYLLSRGSERIMLVGHSLGAIKLLYAQAYHPHPNVTCVAGLSATRLSTASLLASPSGRRFAEWLASARTMIEAGNGRQLMLVDFPFPTWITAAAYVEKYGQGEKYNWISFANRIHVPAFVGFGQLELDADPAFLGIQNDLNRLARSLPQFSIGVIRDADHFYSAAYAAAFDAVCDWLEEVARR